jgi:hypothetical protein
VKLHLIPAAVSRGVVGAALAFTFMLGAYNLAFAEKISLGDGGYWTVLTMSPDGSWGTGTESELNEAIAGTGVQL